MLFLDYISIGKYECTDYKPNEFADFIIDSIIKRGIKVPKDVLSDRVNKLVYDNIGNSIKKQSNPEKVIIFCLRLDEYDYVVKGQLVVNPKPDLPTLPKDISKEDF